MVATVAKRAASTLSLQCGSCHSRKDMWLKARPDPALETLAGLRKHDAEVIAPLLSKPAGADDPSPLLEAFCSARARFLGGVLSGGAFVELLHEQLVAGGLGPGDRLGRPCAAMTAVLHSLDGDREREASLHGAYLRRFPEVHSTCCQARHCFRCHIKGFHVGQSCEAYQAAKATVEDVVPCPGCGLQLTKGDGCGSVNCVCGRGFSWSIELKKVRELG